MPQQSLIRALLQGVAFERYLRARAGVLFKRPNAVMIPIVNLISARSFCTPPPKSGGPMAVDTDLREGLVEHATRAGSFSDLHSLIPLHDMRDPNEPHDLHNPTQGPGTGTRGGLKTEQGEQAAWRLQLGLQDYLKRPHFKTLLTAINGILPFEIMRANYGLFPSGEDYRELLARTLPKLEQADAPAIRELATAALNDPERHRLVLVNLPDLYKLLEDTALQHELLQRYPQARHGLQLSRRAYYRDCLQVLQKYGQKAFLKTREDILNLFTLEILMAEALALPLPQTLTDPLANTAGLTTSSDQDPRHAARTGNDDNSPIPPTEAIYALPANWTREAQNLARYRRAVLELPIQDAERRGQLAVRLTLDFIRLCERYLPEIRSDEDARNADLGAEESEQGAIREELQDILEQVRNNRPHPDDDAPKSGESAEKPLEQLDGNELAEELHLAEHEADYFSKNLLRSMQGELTELDRLRAEDIHLASEVGDLLEDELNFEPAGGERLGQRMAAQVQNFVKSNQGGRLTHQSRGKVDARRLPRSNWDGKIFYQQKAPKNPPDMSLTIVLDCSGSMQSNGAYRDASRAAFALAVACDKLEIPVSCLLYNRETYSLFTESTSRLKRELLAKVKPNEGTDQASAVRRAAKILKDNPAEQHLVIVICDGDIGGEANAKRIAEIRRADPRLTLHAVGIGLPEEARPLYEEAYGEGRVHFLQNRQDYAEDRANNSALMQAFRKIFLRFTFGGFR